MDGRLRAAPITHGRNARTAWPIVVLWKADSLGPVTRAASSTARCASSITVHCSMTRLRSSRCLTSRPGSSVGRPTGGGAEFEHPERGGHAGVSRSDVAPGDRSRLVQGDTRDDRFRGGSYFAHHFVLARPPDVCSRNLPSTVVLYTSKPRLRGSSVIRMCWRTDPPCTAYGPRYGSGEGRLGRRNACTHPNTGLIPMSWFGTARRLVSRSGGARLSWPWPWPPRWGRSSAAVFVSRAPNEPGGK